MKNLLILILILSISLVSLVSCGKNQADDSSEITSSQSEDEPGDTSESITVNSEFYSNSDYIYLQQAVYDIYIAEKGIVDINSTLNYYIESLSYDEDSKTAVVQMTCMELGEGPQFMEIALIKSENGYGWEKKSVKYTEESNNCNLTPADDAFFRNHYKNVQNTAFKFFRAYIMADSNAGYSLIDSLDNPCLEYFNTNKGTLKNVGGFAIEMVSYEFDEKTQSGTVYLEVWFDEDPSEGNEGIDYMCMTIGIKPYVHNNGETKIQYVVSNYDFDT